MTSSSFATAVVALLWPAGRLLEPQAAVPDRRFTLVSSLADYDTLSAVGADSILVHRRPSSHFSVPLVVRLAGPLIVPWRWRRLLLNEGIDTVIVRPSPSSVPLVIAAWLARSRVVLWR